MLIKGGRKLGTAEAVDVFYDGKDFELFQTPIIDTTYTHGAGCTTAAAITANLAKGLSVRDAVFEAKMFITAAIARGFKLNEYVGAVRHSALRDEINI